MAVIACGSFQGTSLPSNLNFFLTKLQGRCFMGKGGGPKVQSLLWIQSVFGAGFKDCMGGSAGEGGPCAAAKGVFSGSKRARTMSLKGKVLFQTLGSIPGAGSESGFPESIFLFGVAFHPHLHPEPGSKPCRARHRGSIAMSVPGASFSGCPNGPMFIL